MTPLRIVDCGHEACAPGHRYGPAMRGYYLLHLVASGSGVFFNGSRRIPVRAGQGFMIFPDDVTVYSADVDTPWEYMWVGFSGGDSAKLVEAAGLSKASPIAELRDRAATALDICAAISGDMAALELGEQAAVGGLLRLMAFIAGSRREGVGGPAVPDSFRRAQWALQANYRRPEYHVEDVASFVGLSRSQLFRIFKRHGEESPQQALARLRLSRARQLLRSTDLTLTEVALSSGYATAARLGEVFRNALNTTPAQYRRAAREARGAPDARSGGE